VGRPADAALDRKEVFVYEDLMRIGIVGTGAMGSAFARLFSRQRHDVVIGSRDPARGAAVADRLGEGIRGSGIREAAEHGEAVLLAVHFVAAREAITAAGPLAGKILMDCTNPLTADFMGLTIGHSTSAAEQIAVWAPQAKVVKVFNHNFSQAVPEPRYDDMRAAAFYCGNDAPSKESVASLVTQIGLEPVDVGPLENARYLEPLAQLVIQLAYKQGIGARFGLGLLRR